MRNEQGARDENMTDDLDIEALRGAVTRAIAAKGFAPGNDELAADFGVSMGAIESGLRSLQSRHAILLHPHVCKPWVVHPFALAPGSCWVETEQRGYWANCLYCALGIAACLKTDASIHTRLGGEAEAVCFTVRDGRIEPSSYLFHLAVPAAQWWNNVIYACSSFQPFRAAADIEDWCERHDISKGAVLTLPQLWAFAQSWYGSYVSEPWRIRGKAEIEAIFAAHGLTGEFWQL